MTIQQLSKDIGISVDTLRIWERRYGFPVPQRDTRGHRSYSNDQIDELRIVKKLQNLGHRPGNIFAMSSAERRKKLKEIAEQGLPRNESLQQLAKDFSLTQIDKELRSQMLRLGLNGFIQQFALPLLLTLDQGWTEGRIPIAREHLVSDRLEHLLRERLNTGHPHKCEKQILFLTLSGERHKLGLLLAAALFHAQGIGCILLNEELPMTELPLLASELEVDGVALSFSGHYPPKQAKTDLAFVRKQLNRHVKLIAGGQAVQRLVKIENLIICTDLKQVPEICRKHFI